MPLRAQLGHAGEASAAILADGPSPAEAASLLFVRVERLGTWRVPLRAAPPAHVWRVMRVDYWAMRLSNATLSPEASEAVLSCVALPCQVLVVLAEAGDGT